MGGAATILFAREDFSIPGGAEIPGAAKNPGALAARFFDLLRDSRPDVVVLDLSRSNGAGVEAILKIRQQSTTPILVVCEPDQQSAGDYRIAGAAECIPAPIDIMQLNQTLQQIIRVTGRARPATVRTASAYAFAGMTFFPHQNRLFGSPNTVAKLTSSESRLLFHFASYPWVLHSRAEVGEVLYGQHRPTSDRAIDVVVNRLRKKLVTLCGPSGQNLIKTEFRRGYMLVADVSTVSASDATTIGAHLTPSAG
ncbi:MAG TPA: winged helix-turn-helix domain-containing protein [Stellaceae bacterium]|nr:winged helix-turn-helix domain-containing protein [Stellaceae bacterium]